MEAVNENKSNPLNTILALSGMILGLFLITKITHTKEDEQDILGKVYNSSKEKKNMPISLNDRQTKIISLLARKRVVTPKELKALVPSISDRTLRRDMKTLVKKKIVLQKGSTKSTFYEYIKNDESNI